MTLKCHCFSTKSSRPFVRMGVRDSRHCSRHIHLFHHGLWSGKFGGCLSREGERAHHFHCRAEQGTGGWTMADHGYGTIFFLESESHFGSKRKRMVKFCSWGVSNRHIYGRGDDDRFIDDRCRSMYRWVQVDDICLGVLGVKPPTLEKQGTSYVLTDPRV